MKIWKCNLKFQLIFFREKDANQEGNKEEEDEVIEVDLDVLEKNEKDQEDID